MFFRSVIIGVVLSVLFAVPLFADDGVAEKPVEQPAEVGAATEPDSSYAEIVAEAVAGDPLQKGKTGIVAIDTLTVNEWDLPT